MSTDRGLKQLYFLLFVPFALQVTYLNLYFERRGLSHGDIGTLGAVANAIGIFAPLVFGQLADKLGHKRPVVMWLGWGAAMFLALHWCGASFWALMPWTILTAVCRSPMIPLVDAYCLDVLQAGGDRQAQRYAPIRLWGSVGFIVAATGVPLLLADGGDSDPVRRLWPVFVGFLMAGLMLVWRTATLPDPALPETPFDYDEPAASVFSVLRVPGLKRLIALLLAGWVFNSAYYVFLSLYLDDIGVADRWKGAYWSMGVVAEVAFMACGPYLLRRLGVRKILLWGMAGRALRLLLLGWQLPPLVVLVLVQPLHALAFAALHLGTIAFMARTVPQQLRASGQAVVTSLVGGVGGVLGSLFAGWVSELATAGYFRGVTDRTGLYAAFLLSGVLHVGVCLVAWFTVREPVAPSEPADEAA